MSVVIAQKYGHISPRCASMSCAFTSVFQLKYAGLWGRDQLFEEWIETRRGNLRQSSFSHAAVHLFLLT